MQDFLRRARRVAKVVRQVVEKFLYAGRRFQCAQPSQLGWGETESVRASHRRNIAQPRRSSNILQSSAWSPSLRKGEGRVRLMQGVSARSPKTPHLYPLPFARGEASQASQPHWLMLTITGRAFFLMCTNGESRSGRPSSRIANCFDNLLDCVNHQLRFLGLNVVRAFGCNFVFGFWCKRRQCIL